MSTEIKYTKRRGIARTKHGNRWLIDHNSLAIDETVKIPDESIGKLIGTPLFEWAELIDEKAKLEEAKIKQLKVEEAFKSFCITNNIKYKSKTYYKYQLIYFNGAISVLGEIPPKWGVCMIGSREIIEDYT